MAVLLHERPDFLEIAAQGGITSGQTKRNWPQWKRIMITSLAALYRWNPLGLTVNIPSVDSRNQPIKDAQGRQLSTPVVLTYAQNCEAWQAGYRLGFEAGAGWKRKPKQKRKRKTLTRS